MKLSQGSLEELQWWCDNIEQADYPLCTPNAKIEITLYTDASNKGWGAVMGAEKIGGRWSEAESKNHINCLELMAAFFGLKAFCSSMKSIHIRIYSDNTTTVNDINSMGGTHSMECNSVAKDIWLFCITRQIWILQLISQARKTFRLIRSPEFFMTIKNGCLGPKFWGNLL